MKKFIFTLMAALLLPLCTYAQQTTKGNSVVVPAVSFSNGSPVYSFRFDDAPLGEHIDGEKGESDQRSRSFTFSAWINIKDGRNGSLMGMGLNDIVAAFNGFSIQYTDGKLSLRGRSQLTGDAYQDMYGTETTDPGTPLGEWVFISLVADPDNNTVTLYKNCQPISSFLTYLSIYLNPGAGCFYIADRGASVAISEVQLWTKALTPDELKESYNLSISSAPEELVAWYKAEELAEGSTTELKNLGSEGKTTAAVLYGGTRYTFEGLKFLSPEPQTVTLTGEGRQLKTVTVNAIQPTLANNSFTITGENGRSITDSAILFEKLTVLPSLTQGLKVLSVNVTNTDDNTTAFLTPDEIPFFAESNISVSLRLNDVLNLTFAGEHCSLMATIDGTTSEVTAAGLKVNNGCDVELTVVPEEGYAIESASINGQDATDLFTSMSYTIKFIDEDKHIAVNCEIPRYFITVLNPQPADGEDDLNVVFGELHTSDFEVHPDYISGEPLEVIEGDNLILCILPAEPIGEFVHRVASLTDNGNDITALLEEQEDGSFTYPINDIHANHTFVLTQTDLLGSISKVGNDTQSTLRYTNGTLISTTEGTIEVTDLCGRTVARTNSGSLSTAGLLPGAYIAKATTADSTATIKFIK